MHNTTIENFHETISFQKFKKRIYFSQRIFLFENIKTNNFTKCFTQRAPPYLNLSLKLMHLL